MKALAPLIACAALLGAGAAHADSIVNISATQNGEQTGGADCNVACEGSLIDPAQLTLGAGSYRITDAWSPANGLEPGALYDAWNFEAGNSAAWAWHWKMLADDGSDGSTISQANYASFILADVDASTSDEFSSESAAADFGYNTPPTDFTLSVATTLDFVVNDYDLIDNAGGVSLDIACTAGSCLQSGSPVPEPGTFPLALAALALLGVTRLRYKR